MKPFEIFSYQPPGPNWSEPHPAIIISHPDRADRKNPVEVLIGSSQRANRAPEAHEFLLDSADGLDWPTLVKCDVIYAAPRDLLQHKRGMVSAARRPALIRKIIAAHGWQDVLVGG